MIVKRGRACPFKHSMKLPNKKQDLSFELFFGVNIGEKQSFDGLKEK